MKRPSAKGNSAVWRLGLILLLSVALWPLSPRAEAPDRPLRHRGVVSGRLVGRRSRFVRSVLHAK